jgi:hypothetical protein
MELEWRAIAERLNRHRLHRVQTLQEDVRLVGKKAMMDEDVIGDLGSAFSGIGISPIPGTARLLVQGVLYRSLIGSGASSGLMYA